RRRQPERRPPRLGPRVAALSAPPGPALNGGAPTTRRTPAQRSRPIAGLHGEVTMKRAKRLAASCVVSAIGFLSVLVLPESAVRAQLPGLPAPTKDNPEATVATTSGPIIVDKPVDDEAVQENLGALLPQLPGVRSVEVSVN